MDHSRAIEAPCGRMYVFSISLCIVALVTSVWLVFALIPVNPGLLLLVGSQVGVYAVIARFAWLCRKNPTASVIVILMAILDACLGATMLSFLLTLVSEPSAGPLIFFLVVPIFGQMITGFLGCYMGYAVIEHQRVSTYQGNSDRGKLLVIFMAGIAVGFVAFLWSFAA